MHDIGTAAYYDGPLQVRTSEMAGIVAALAGGALYVVIHLFLIGGDGLPPGIAPPSFRNNPILFALYGIAGCGVLFYIFVHRAHAFLQRRGKADLKSYVLAGVFVPAGFALAFIGLMGPLGFIFVLPWLFPSVAAMATYHRLAGMEPLDLPDDIEVRDARTLLPADHVRRRTRRFVSVH